MSDSARGDITRADLEEALRAAARAAEADPGSNVARAFFSYLLRRLILHVAWLHYAAVRGLDPEAGAPPAEPADGAAPPPATDDDAGAGGGRDRR